MSINITPEIKMPYKDPEIRKQKAAERWLTWAARNPEKRNESMRNWRRRNPKYMLRSSAKRRAERDGVEFALALEDIPEIPETCPIALIPIRYREDNKQGPCDNSPSLDRVDPTLGYIPGNVRVLSHKGNRMKSHLTIEDCGRIIAYMKGEL